MPRTPAAGCAATRRLKNTAPDKVTDTLRNAGIDHSGGDDESTADPASLAGAVAYLASQSSRAMTHELQVTPALDRWVP